MISRLQRFVLAFTVLASPATALAQSQLPGKEEPHGNVVQAVIVFLCVTLGLILVNRSASRSSELLIDEVDDD